MNVNAVLVLSDRTLFTEMKQDDLIINLILIHLCWS